MEYIILFIQYSCCGFHPGKIYKGSIAVAKNLLTIVFGSERFDRDRACNIICNIIFTYTIVHALLIPILYSTRYGTSMVQQ